MKIGPYTLENRLMVAPMAGVTDRPFRKLCKEQGASIAVSEMISANPKLLHTEKSRKRTDHHGESGVRSVQIAGGEPKWLAKAAKLNVANGAQIIDINMGCPAKKVCNKAAGSALLSNPKLVKEILETVVDTVNVPVTLKIRTGPSLEHRNGVEIAKIAEAAGIQALAVHGRTRACRFKGEVEYDTIREIKQSVDIPVIANGDIDSPEKAKYVLEVTGADAIMIGRAAQGRPWIFREIAHYLKTGEFLTPPELAERKEIMLRHISELHSFYGEYLGPRIARKHVSWYLNEQPGNNEFRRKFNVIEEASEQIQMAQRYFEQQIVQRANVA